MRRYKKYLLLVCLSSFIHISYAQRVSDTTAVIKEYNKLMAFISQPYIHYAMLSKVAADPVMLEEDTLTSTGEFYKDQNNIYYSGGQDEMYLEDSFKIQINHERKTIWISKIDDAAKEKLSMLPLSGKKFSDMLRQEYTISRSSLNDSTGQFTFDTKPVAGAASEKTTNITVVYLKKKYLIKQMNIEVRMQEPAADAIVAALKGEGVDVAKLTQTIDGKDYLVKKQRLEVSYSDLDITKQSVAQMPNWRNALEYDESTKSFKAIGAYTGYAITKMF
jgi:hypothetical protein